MPQADPPGRERKGKHLALPDAHSAGGYAGTSPENPKNCERIQYLLEFEKNKESIRSASADPPWRKNRRNGEPRTVNGYEETKMLLVKRQRWFALCLLLALTGCGTLRSGLSTGSNSKNLTLTDDEINFGRALAHYCRALISEEELGCSSAESLEHFIKAAELDPGQPQLHARAAIAYQATGQHDKAREEFRKAIKLSPGTTPLYLELAKTYFLLDRDSKALKILRKGLRKADRPGAILIFCYNYGVRYIITKQIARAIPCFEIIARNDPSKTQQFYELLGELYAQLGYEEESIRHFILATKSDPPNPNPFLKLAALYMKTDPAKAIETLNQAASIMPDDPVIFFFLGLVYTDQKQFDKAILEFQKAEKAVEGSNKGEKLNADFYLQYGAAYEQSGQIEMAEEVFEQCLKLYPQAHQVLNYLAYMWAEKGIKLEKGLEYITQALELEPDNAAYIDTLGWIYYKSKKYEEALEQIQKANDLIKNDPTMIDHLGDIFEALHDREKAMLHWKRSFLLDPENKAVATKLENHGVNLDQLRKEAENLKESPAPRRGKHKTCPARREGAKSTE